MVDGLAKPDLGRKSSASLALRHEVKKEELSVKVSLGRSRTVEEDVRGIANLVLVHELFIVVFARFLFKISEIRTVNQWRECLSLVK